MTDEEASQTDSPENRRKSNSDGLCSHIVFELGFVSSLNSKERSRGNDCEDEYKSSVKHSIEVDEKSEE